VKRTEVLKQKMMTWDQIAQQSEQWHKNGMKVVFTNGCFDILHYGHIDLLSGAADLGDHLVIGLNSDSSVRTLKGPDRPVNDENTRAIILAAMEFVSAVVVFDNPTPLELIQVVKPDILVKGGDYDVRSVVGYDFLSENGGEVRILPFVEGYSTTSLIKKILKSS